MGGPNLDRLADAVDGLKAQSEGDAGVTLRVATDMRQAGEKERPRPGWRLDALRAVVEAKPKTVPARAPAAKRAPRRPKD